MIIAALVRLFKKIKPNTKMSKAASTVSKKHDYEKSTFVELTKDSIKLKYKDTDTNKTATLLHPLTQDELERFKEKIYNIYFVNNKLTKGNIFAAINKKTGKIDYLFWESPNKKTKINF
jgi:hypothetical protein